MATVKGKTSEKIDELIDASVVSGSVTATGSVTLQTRGGNTLNIGSMSDAIVDVSIDPNGNIILTRKDGSTENIGATTRPIDAYPVGAIFASVVPTNPATLLGGGTWTRWAKGRVPVGVDEADTTFDTVEEVGGEKQHTLTLSESPTHSHAGTTGSNNVGHIHGLNIQWANTTSTSGTGYRVTDVANASGGGGTNATASTGGQSANHVHGFTTNSQGGGLPHNILQPYITCYMWKRTA